MRRADISLGLVLLAGLGSGAAHAQAQETVLDGVFTAEQAARGEAVFSAKCSRCHEGADVDGPPLTGDPFIERWREDNLATLFQFLKTRMPQDAPGSLDDSAYTDILARLLRANQYPPGNSELKSGSVAGILLVGSGGPKPLPTNAMVLAVGCLAAEPNNVWILANVPALSRTQTGDETSDAELKTSAARSLGTGSYRLPNAATFKSGFSPEIYKGHKVQVKGVLGRQANIDRINVLSLESLSPACGKQ